MTLETKTFFPYSWDLDSDNEEKTIIRIYGLDENNKNVAVKIPNYTPFVYLELPDHIKWDVNKAQDLVDAINDKLPEEHHPIMNKLMFKKKTYGADITNGKRKNFPFLFLSFASKKGIYSLMGKARWGFFTKRIGKIIPKVHEDNVNAILQMNSLRGITYTDWLKIEGKVPKNKETTCDYEYIASWRKLEPIKGNLNLPKPLIMSFDIEVNSSVVGSMPNSDRPADKVFMISCIFGRQGSKEETWEKYLIYLGEVDNGYIGSDVKLRPCESEGEVISEYSRLILQKNPNIIIGYNIFGFDIDYLSKRSKVTSCIMEFLKQGFNSKRLGKEITIEWSSSAYKNQKFQFIQSDGRLFIDLLPLIRRDYTFANYRLKTVSTFFLGETKDPLTPQGIFKCYRIGMEGWNSEDNTKRIRGRKALNIVGKYCVQDTVLPLKIFEKIQGWIGLVELSKVCNTEIFNLFTKGQQIKVFSQIYRDCLNDNYVVQKNGYIAENDESYTGAYVFLPKPGVYDRVVSLDFNSLYPSIMIAYNICPSTWVKEGSDIPIEKCNVFDWHDHYNCVHDPVKRPGKKNKVICKKRRYMFLKEPIGILPRLLKNLLDARKAVKNRMKDVYAKLKDPNVENKEDLEILLIVLDKQQLSLKISCNSFYGSLGVKRGMFPFMPAAMCITACGRESIQKAAEILQTDYKAQLVYGDSVTGDTPLILRDINGMVTIREIMDLANIWESYPLFKPLDDSLKDKEQNITVPYEVWTANGWAKIRRVIRHKTNKKIYKITTHTGSVDVTEDHSLLSYNGDKVKPNDVKLGDKLFHNFPTEFPEIFLIDTTNWEKFQCRKCKENRPIYEYYLSNPKNPCKICIFHQNEGLRKDKEKKYFSTFEYIYRSSIGTITYEEAFVWGFFMADGSCGKYEAGGNNYKYSWAINNQTIDNLNRTMEYLKIAEPNYTFKILDTLSSSGVYKLVPSGRVMYIVEKYRNLLYYKKAKIVPNIILNGNREIRMGFLEGYYIGDGSKTGQYSFEKGNLNFTAKNKITSQTLYYLIKSLGYKAAIRPYKTKKNTHIFTTCKSFRKDPQGIKGIDDITNYTEDGIPEEITVYDIETEDGTFGAGVGEIIVKNTDSCYVIFPWLTEAKEIWDYSIKVASEISTHFPPAMTMAFEDMIFWRYLILSKKRYMSLGCKRDGVVSDEIHKKGVLLKRRDNSKFTRDIYSHVVMSIFHKEPKEKILNELVEGILKVYTSPINYKDFIITKSVKEINEYKIKPLSDDPKKKEKRLNDLKCNEEDYPVKALPSQAQLMLKMKRRGENVGAGTRLEYVIVDVHDLKARVFEKIEDYSYFIRYSTVLSLDLLYYIKNLINPIDELLSILNEKNFLKNFYKMVKCRYECNLRIKNYTMCKTYIEGEEDTDEE